MTGRVADLLRCCITLSTLFILANAMDCANTTVTQASDCANVNPNCTTLGTLSIEYVAYATCTLPTIHHVDNLVVNCNADFPLFMTHIETVDTLNVTSRRDCGLWKLKAVNHNAMINVNRKALGALGSLETVYRTLTLKFVSPEDSTKFCTNIFAQTLVSSHCKKEEGRLICCKIKRNSHFLLYFFLAVVVGLGILVIALLVDSCCCKPRRGALPALPAQQPVNREPIVDQPVFFTEPVVVQLSPNRMCCVCMVKESSRLYSCGHLCCCDTCDERLTKCPICTKVIEKRVRVYV